MKKILLVCTICLIAVVCTGCVKISYNIEINSNNEISIAETQALNLEPFKAMKKDADKELKKGFEEAAEEYKSEGYKVDEYKDDTYTGITISKDKITFKDVLKSLPKGLKNDANKFTMQSGLFKNTYKIHLVADKEQMMSSVSGNGEESDFSNQQIPENNYNEQKAISTQTETDFATGETVETSKMSDGSVKTKRINKSTGEVTEIVNYKDGRYSKSTYNEKDMQGFGDAIGGAIEAMPGMTPLADLTIKIPVKAKSHNANKVISDTEYQWNLLTEGETVEVNLEYEKYNTGLIAVLIAAFLGVIIILIVKFKSNSTQEPY